MRKTAAVIGSVFLLACGSPAKQEMDNKGSDTGSTQQLVDTGKPRAIDSVPAIEQPIVLNDIPKTKEPNGLLKYFIEKYSVNYTEINPEELRVYVLDRFGSDKKYKVFLQKKIPLEVKGEKVFPVAEVRAYIYKDSAQCANALNNWLNCFGNNCERVEVNVPVTIQSTPGFYIINEKNIVCLDYKAEFEKNNWKNMYTVLRRLFATRKSRIIEVKAKGEVTWLQ